MTDLHTRVFNNIKDDFVNYRHFEIINILDSHMLTKSGKDKKFEFINQDLVIFECINRSISDESKNHVLILLMAPLNDGVSNSSKSSGVTFVINKYKTNLVILVSYAKLTSQQLKKVIEEHKTCKTIYNYNYSDLAIVKPKAEIASEYRILTQNDIDELIIAKKIIINDLPIMLFNDPMNVWIGATGGQVIAFTRHTDGFGTSESYRYIIDV